MNTYTDRLIDLNTESPLMCVYEGNAANGKDGRIPELHPIDAVIVHDKREHSNDTSKDDMRLIEAFRAVTGLRSNAELFTQPSHSVVSTSAMVLVIVLVSGAF